MVTYDWQTIDDMALVLSDGFRYLFCYDSVLCLFASLRISVSMGRRPWATPEQLEFLHSYTNQLAEAKARTVLTALYATVAVKFQTHWKPEPYNPLAEPGKTASELAALGVTRLYDVCFYHHSCILLLTFSTLACYELVQEVYPELPGEPFTRAVPETASPRLDWAQRPKETSLPASSGVFGPLLASQRLSPPTRG